jgi:hypothetical protein
MADAVASKVLFESPTKLIMQFTNLSDGTGESAVVKVDKSTLTCANGLEPTSLRIDCIRGDVTGMAVSVLCARTSPLTIAVLGGLGEVELCFGGVGYETNTAGSTGDITFTTTGQSSGDSYTLVIEMTKKE